MRGRSWRAFHPLSNTSAAANQQNTRDVEGMSYISLDCTTAFRNPRDSGRLNFLPSPDSCSSILDLTGFERIRGWPISKTGSPASHSAKK